MKMFLIAIGVVVAVVLICIFWYFSIINGEITLANVYDAQFKVRETSLDKMHKVLESQYGLTKESSDQFIRSVAAATEGRKGGSLFKSVQESAAGLGMPLDIYKAMLASIEGEMANFKRAQDTLVDVWQTHQTYCQTMPNSFFVGDKVREIPEMITASATKETVKSGIDNQTLIPLTK